MSAEMVVMLLIVVLILASATGPQQTERYLDRKERERDEELEDLELELSYFRSNNRNCGASAVEVKTVLPSWQQVYQELRAVNWRGLVKGQLIVYGCLGLLMLALWLIGRV